MAGKTMKAVVFDGPHKVSIQDRPVPVCKSASRPCGLAPSTIIYPSTRLPRIDAVPG